MLSQIAYSNKFSGLSQKFIATQTQTQCLIVNDEISDSQQLNHLYHRFIHRPITHSQPHAVKFHSNGAA